MNEQSMSKEKRAELLMSHYKDTFEHILYHWKVRNRLFMYVLLLLAIMALDIYSPSSIARVINDYLAQKLDKANQVSPIFHFKVIGTAVWFLLLSLIISYYQRSILVDRLYRYIANLEEQICKSMDGDFVTREGKAYLSKHGVFNPNEIGPRPLFIRAIGPLYIYIFPALLMAFVVIKFLQEFPSFDAVTDYLNLIFGIMIVVYNIFYLIWIIWHRK